MVITGPQIKVLLWDIRRARRMNQARSDRFALDVRAKADERHVQCFCPKCPARWLGLRIVCHACGEVITA